jgi:hypothetical protein
MGWVTDRRVGWLEWRLHNLRYSLLQWLVGNDKVLMNVNLCRPGQGVVGPPPPNGRLFIHNVTLAREDGTEFNMEEVMVPSTDGGPERNPLAWHKAKNG